MRQTTFRAFRGYGTADEVFLMGRVYLRPAWEIRPKHRFVRALVSVVRRTLSKGVGGVPVRARISGTEGRTETDRDGYFSFDLQLPQRLEAGSGWHAVSLVVDEKDGPTAEGQVFVPPPAARFAVVSDIDDTVVETGVSNKLKMMWRMFATAAESREAFPGVAAFYRALHRGGASTDEHNPMVYVSRGPWSLYGVLEDFFRLHDIPVGPILFLREWGMTLQRPLPQPAREHKTNLIRRMLDVYSDLPFVMIGDSGQRDPEIYARIVRENPNRVRAIYIRRVGKSDPERREKISALAKETHKAGVDMLLADHTSEMARHAAEIGLIDEAALAEIGQAEREATEKTPDGST